MKIEIGVVRPFSTNERRRAAKNGLVMEPGWIERKTKDDMDG